MKNKNRIDIECDDGCGMLRLERDDWDELPIVYLQYYVPAFYAKQDGILRTIWNRIKLIWHIAIGKEYLLYEVLVEGNDVPEFEDGLRKFLDD